MEWLRKAIDKYKEANRPENVKARLKAQIEIERLKMERDIIEHKRRKAKEQFFKVGM